jgi:hypothetical protein
MLRMTSSRSSGFPTFSVNRSGTRPSGAMAAWVHDLRTGPQTDTGRWTSSYGGGPGMVMKPEPPPDAIEALAGGRARGGARVILLTPQERPINREWRGWLRPRTSARVWTLRSIAGG